MLSELAGVDDSEEIHSVCTEDCFLGLYRGGWFRIAVCSRSVQRSVFLVCAVECVPGG
ncbi:hypothetical protein CsSME_00052501 [Camellia sinensis var. sinensis]